MSRDLLFSNSECGVIEEFLFLFTEVLGEVFTAFPIKEIFESSWKFKFFIVLLLFESLLFDKIFPNIKIKKKIY